jgi:hypothetical protein
MLEPNAGGRALKLARVALPLSDSRSASGGHAANNEVTWGAELAQGRDESLAVDVAVSGDRGVAVWDDVAGDDKRSVIQLATFDPQSLRSVTTARPVSPPKSDAEQPRVVPRPGGFWLAWLVTTEAERDKPPSKAGPKKDKDDVPDEEHAGETFGASWIEVMPLDGNGSPTSTARRATAADGHVLAFDLEPGDDGAAILAWRDDESPTGSGGGSVLAATVRLGGIGEPRVVTEENVGAGTPDLLPGWIGIAGPSGPKRFAPLAPDGTLAGDLAVEPVFGAGEPIAGSGNDVLVATPAGKAMRLSLVRCAR